MPGPYADAYSPPIGNEWYHHTTSLFGDSIPGVIASDLLVFGGMETVGNLYSSGRSMLFPANAEGIRGAIGRTISPFQGGNRGFAQAIQGAAAKRLGFGFTRPPAAAVGQYYKGGVFRHFQFLSDANRGSGIFKNVAGRSGTERLHRLVGGKVANRITSAAAVSLGVRTAFTALNFGIGLSIGRGIGDMVANYRPDYTKEEILETGGFFADTRGSFTQRQRAIQTIHNSQLTTRAALGNEASFLHV